MVAWSARCEFTPTRGGACSKFTEKITDYYRELPKYYRMYTEKLPQYYADITDELHKNYGDITAELLLYYSTVSERLHGNYRTKLSEYTEKLPQRLPIEAWDGASQVVSSSIPGLVEVFACSDHLSEVRSPWWTLLQAVASSILTSCAIEARLPRRSRVRVRVWTWPKLPAALCNLAVTLH